MVWSETFGEVYGCRNILGRRMAGSCLCSRKASCLAAWKVHPGDGSEVPDRRETTAIIQEDEVA